MFWRVTGIGARGFSALAVTLLVAHIFIGIGINKAAAVDGEVLYGGTAASFSNVDDATDGPKNIGFTFNYFGNDYTTAHISTNGVVSLASPSAAYSNDSTGLSTSIMGFWDDLILSTGSKVYYKTIGAPGSQKFIVQWTNMYFYGTSITMGTFQVILYEGSNNIQLQYRDLLGGSRSYGDSATIGIRGSSSGSIFSYNTALITEGQALLYTPNGSGGYNAVNSAATYDPIYLQDTNAPDSPSLINPLDGTTGATVTPTFEWQTADKATSYNILISTTSSFSSTVVNQTGISSTSYTLGSPLSYNTTYYWRVAAVNSYGTNLSGTRSFTTSGSPNSPPNTPSNLSSSSMVGGGTIGAAGLISSPLNMSLSDSDVGQQVRFRVQIASDNAFTSPEIDYRSAYFDQGSATYTYGESGGTYLSGSSSTVLPDGNYYLRVRAEDAAAASSSWTTVSGVAFVYDGTAPDTLDKPQQIGSSVASTGSATIGWNATAAPDAAALPYLLDYSLAADFSTYTTIASSQLSATLSGLSNNAYYYVRVRVIDVRGNISAPSSPLVIYIPALPTVVPSPTKKTTSAPKTLSTTTSVSESQTSTPTTTTLQNSSQATGPTTPDPTPKPILQTVVVYVVDSDGNPVEGARVTLHSVPMVAYTNTQGKAVFSNVESGVHRAIVEYGQYSDERTVEIASASTTPTNSASETLENANLTFEIPAVATSVKSSDSSKAHYYALLLLTVVVIWILYRRHRKARSI